MNRVAFVFSSAPHGSSAGREGLDALLAVASFSEEVGVFFISDGVFQIISEQKPGIILSRNYIISFKVLTFYNIRNIWICADSMRDRGLEENTILVLDAKPISSQILRKKLLKYNVILTF